jgi:hypothetical protein
LPSHFLFRYMEVSQRMPPAGNGASILRHKPLVSGSQINARPWHSTKPVNPNAVAIGQHTQSGDASDLSSLQLQVRRVDVHDCLMHRWLPGCLQRSQQELRGGGGVALAAQIHAEADGAEAQSLADYEAFEQAPVYRPRTLRGKRRTDKSQ